MDLLDDLLTFVNSLIQRLKLLKKLKLVAEALQVVPTFSLLVSPVVSTEFLS
jgi:hypothetical protein